MCEATINALHASNNKCVERLSQTYSNASYDYTYDRSSGPELFCKENVLRNFAKFIGKHLCQSLFFNRVAGLRPSKKESLAQVFSC